MSTKRLFFALWPDERQREALRNTISPVAKLVEGSALYRNAWHVTLFYVGEFDEERIPALKASAAEVPFEPFRLRFDRAEFWPRANVAVLAPQIVPPELTQLVEGLTEVGAAHGIRNEDRVYRPHVTIVRRARKFETQRLTQPLMLQWTGFELVESESNRGESSYHVI